LSGNAQKVRTIFDVERLFFGKPQISLVDECGRLQGVIRALLLEVIASQTSQLVIDERQNRLQCLAVPISPMEKQFAERTRGL
jgi:hypothetical protein